MIIPQARLSVTKAARGFSELINEVFYRGARFILIKGDKAVASIEPCTPELEFKLGRIAEIMSALPPLDAKERRSFARDVARARGKAKTPKDPWAI